MCLDTNKFKIHPIGMGTFKKSRGGCSLFVLNVWRGGVRWWGSRFCDTMYGDLIKTGNLVWKKGFRKFKMCMTSLMEWMTLKLNWAANKKSQKLGWIIMSDFDWSLKMFIKSARIKYSDFKCNMLITCLKMKRQLFYFQLWCKIVKCKFQHSSNIYPVLYEIKETTFRIFGNFFHCFDLNLFCLLLQELLWLWFVFEGSRRARVVWGFQDGYGVLLVAVVPCGMGAGAASNAGSRRTEGGKGCTGFIWGPFGKFELIQAHG